MHTVHVVLALATAAANIAAAVADFLRSGWILDNMTKYGVPHSWLSPLGLAKAAGGLGLLAGFVVPALGIAAAVGLVLYFAGAVVTVVRAGWYSHLAYPSAFLLLAAGTLALGVATA